MIIKILIGVAIIGLLGFIIKAKAISKSAYNSFGSYAAFYTFFAITILPMLYLIFFV